MFVPCPYATSQCHLLETNFCKNNSETFFFSLFVLASTNSLNIISSFHSLRTRRYPFVDTKSEEIAFHKFYFEHKISSPHMEKIVE